MPVDFDKITVLCGTKEVHEIQKCRPLEPFDTKVMNFFATVSKEILNSKEAHEYSDVISLAFFLRKSNLYKIYEKYDLTKEKRIGRGLVFHIAPSNVAVNFAYSIVSALLAGNYSIVKISGKEFPQIKIITDSINNVEKIPEHSWITPYINVWRYLNEYQEITDDISKRCQIRMIWGGDETIEIIRRHTLQAHAYDITFSERYSICILNAESILETEDISVVAQNFYNDTYLSDQNACTSPFLIIWSGLPNVVERAQKYFWDAIDDIVHKKYELNASGVMDKLETVCKVAIAFTNHAKIQKNDNFIIRIQIDEVSNTLSDYRCNSGLFFEYVSEEKFPPIDAVSLKCQTLSYYGYTAEELQNWVIESNLMGIDRIVPIGRTMDFGLVWDGYDLIRMLSRRLISF